MSAFDLDGYIQENSPSTSGGFDVDSYIADHQDNPSLLAQAGQAALKGIGYVGNKIDAYTGAPVRAAISAAQNGGDPIGAFEDQFGQDNSTAPTGKQIAEKAGLSTSSILSPGAQNFVSQYVKNTPAGFIANKVFPGSVESAASASPAGVAGAGIDIIANPINFIPGGEVAGTLGKGAEAVADTSASAAGWASKKLFSSVFGVTEDNAAKYLADRAGINAAPELSTIKDGVDSAVKNLSDAVDSGKTQVLDAKSVLSGMQSDVRNQLIDAKVDARKATQQASDMFKDAAANLIQPLKDVPAPTASASDVSDMVGQLKDKVTGASGSALDTLKDSDAKIDLTPVYAKIDDTVEKLNAQNTDATLSVANKLKAYKARLMQSNNETQQVGFQPSGKIETLAPAIYERSAPEGLAPARFLMGDPQDQWVKNGLLGKEVTPAVEYQPIGPKWGPTSNIDAPGTKALIQGLNTETDYDRTAGSFGTVNNNAFKGVRATLDAALKDASPEYKAQMAALAPDAALLEKSKKAFGTPEMAVSKLGRLNTPRGAFDRTTLGALEDATGNSGAVTAGADKFAQAQAILKDPQVVQRMQKALPEYQAFQDAQANLAKMNPQWTREQLANAMAGSQEAKNLAQAQGSLARAQSAFEPVSRLAPGSTENQLKSFGKPAGAPIETARAFQNLDSQAGTNFTKQIQDRSVLDSFDKPYTHGSRNAAFGAAVGGLMHGLPGVEKGAIAGTIIDRYGPKIGKTILDVIGKIQENPTVQTIRSLSVPESVKSDLIQAFNYAKVMPSGTASAAAQMAKPSTGPDKWAQQGIKKLGIQDPAFAGKLFSDPKAKQLLIQASDLAPNSKAMNAIMAQIKKGWGQS